MVIPHGNKLSVTKRETIAIGISLMQTQTHEIIYCSLILRKVMMLNLFYSLRVTVHHFQMCCEDTVRPKNFCEIIYHKFEYFLE